MAKITHVIVHCSDSAFGCASIIRDWHLKRGFRDIGYHYVILNGFIKTRKDYDHLMDGSIEVGRPLDFDSVLDATEIGAHALGYNGSSIGVCLIGPNPEANASAGAGFSDSQLNMLNQLLRRLCLTYNISPGNVIGHNETASGKKEGKTCPNLDMDLVRDRLARKLGLI